jgi:membrane-associated phospholipid phosphatase
VDKARQIARESQLTPILPSPKNPTHPAFQLYYEIDLPVLGVSSAFAFGRLVRQQKAFCAPLCDPADLNPLDRVTAGWYDPGWGTASDFLLYGTLTIGAVVLVVDEGFVDALNDAVVVTEAVVSTTAVASIMTLAAGRPRPELFGTNAPLDVRNSSDAALSFLSGHAAAASSLATSLFIAEKRLHPGSKWPWLVLGTTGALAVATGVSRIFAGKHFITDVTGGLIVGSSCGILIPSLHGSPVRVVPVVSDTQRGLSLVGTF